MHIIDCNTEKHIAGLDAALEALLSEKPGDDETPVADRLDDLPKVWRNGYLYFGSIACGYPNGRMAPERDRFEETDGEWNR